MAVALALVLVVPLAGCGSGKLEIVFLVPDGDGLSPLDEQISDVVLVRDDLGTSPQRTSSEVSERDQALDVGSIDPGDGLRIGVELRSATQRLVGIGRSELLDIGSSASAKIEIHLRRPYIYVTGGTSLAAFDSAKDSGELTFVSELGAVSDPQQVATSSDGAQIVVVAGSVDAPSLTRISTSDHMSIAGDPIALTLPASDLAVSDDGVFALVTHTGADGGVSVVGRESSNALFVELGNVTDAALTPSELGDLAFLVVDGGSDCTGPASSIIPFSLTEGEAVGSPIAASGPVSDAAVLADGSLAVALPCADQVAHFAPDGSDLGVLAEVTRASAVTASGPRVLIIGTLPADGTVGQRLELVSVDVAADVSGDDENLDESRVELPAVQERVSTTAFSRPGDQLSRQLDPDDLRAVEAVALPGGDAVAVLAISTFSAEDNGIVLPALDLEVWDYTLIDIATGTPVQRVRTFCDIQEGGALVGNWQCTLEPGEAATAQDFRPLGLAALYGGQ